MTPTSIHLAYYRKEMVAALKEARHQIEIATDCEKKIGELLCQK